MQLQFSKYHGTGNDFILADNRNEKLHLSTQQIAFLCDRHFGIGADGLMLLELEDGYDFKMVYYNSDGNESSMCGNGGRCLVSFARKLGIIKENTTFIAIDGLHNATIDSKGIVSLRMGDVSNIEYLEDRAILDTGSPHYIKWVDDVDIIDVISEGRSVRNSARFEKEGINVNFLEDHGERIRVRTYERGVENETLSCGTGVTAAAIAAAKLQTGMYNTIIETPGGSLEVSFEKSNAYSAENIFLKGPAKLVFEGVVYLS